MKKTSQAEIEKILEDVEAEMLKKEKVALAKLQKEQKPRKLK